MIDEKIGRLTPDNMRSLLHFLAQEIDLRLAHHRQSTLYGEVRPSDVRVFAYAALGAASLSDVARVLGISRQAVHMSARRLQDLGVIELVAQLHDKRERAITLTDKGIAASATGKNLIEAVEQELADVIGRDGIETLRSTLTVLIHYIRKKNLGQRGAMPLA